MFVNSYVENCQEDSHRPHQCQYFSGIKNSDEQSQINRISLLRIHFINSMTTIYTTPIYFEGYSYLKFDVSLCCHSNFKTYFGSYFCPYLHYFQIKELHRITNQSKSYSPPLDNTSAYKNAIKCVIVFLSVFLIRLINPPEYTTSSRITYRIWTEQCSYFQHNNDGCTHIPHIMDVLFYVPITRGTQELQTSLIIGNFSQISM
jgi:hypothetical protein